MRPTRLADRYAVAILATAVALFVRQLLTPLYGSENPYHTVWLAVAFSAWYCGFGPSIVTALLGALGVWYSFIPPFHSFAMHNRSDLFGALGFLVFSSAIIALGESNRRGYVARSRLAAIVQSSDDAIISKDLDGVICTWNKGAERVFGYTAEEAVGQHITIIIPPDRRSEEAMILDKLRKGERIEHFETVRLHKNGTNLDISVTISPVKDAQAEWLGLRKLRATLLRKSRLSERCATARSVSVPLWRPHLNV